MTEGLFQDFFLFGWRVWGAC